MKITNNSDKTRIFIVTSLVGIHLRKLKYTSVLVSYLKIFSLTTQFSYTRTLKVSDRSLRGDLPNRCLSVTVGIYKLVSCDPFQIYKKLDRLNFYNRKKSKLKRTRRTSTRKRDYEVTINKNIKPFVKEFTGLFFLKPDTKGSQLKLL